MDKLPDIPLSCVPEECLRMIAEPLDSPGASDFKIFAQKLDAYCDYQLYFSTPKLNALCGGYLHPPNGPAYEVLREAELRGVTIDAVYQVLKGMRLAVANDLKRYVPEICLRYERMNGQSLSAGHVDRCSCGDCVRHWSVSHQSHNIRHNVPRSPHSDHAIGNENIIPPTNRQSTSDNVPYSRQTRLIDNAMNDLSMEECPSNRNPSDPRAMNISSHQRGFSEGRIFHNDRLDYHNYHPIPPSDDDDDDIDDDDEESNCTTCEHSRLTNPDETQKKILRDAKVTSTCNNCCERKANFRNASHEGKFNITNSTECTCGKARDDIRRHSGSDIPPEEGAASNMQRRLSRSQELNNSQGLVCTCSPGDHIPETENNRIFVSFSDAGKGHIEEVFKLIGILKQSGFMVKCDMYQHALSYALSGEDRSMSMTNVNDWLQNNFNRSRFVVFCITPLYYEHTKPSVDHSPPHSQLIHTQSVKQAVNPSSAEVYPSEDHLHTKFLYTQAQNEFMHNLSKNKRFLPVIFTNSGANRNHIPAIFQSTTVYRFPDVKYLMEFLDSVRNQRP